MRTDPQPFCGDCRPNPRGVVLLCRLHAAAPRLVGALRPFARLWLRTWDARPDDLPVWATDDEQITIGDIRRARALLAEVGKEG